MNNGSNTLWYTFPAHTWNEALPVGNGRIGAMVYGDAAHERMCLNEDTLWSGRPGYYSNPKALDAYRKARELALQGKYPEAQLLLEHDFTSLWSQVYLPLGDLFIDMKHDSAPENYRRALSLDEGVHTVEYIAGGVKFVRETIISQPAQVMAVRLTASEPGRLSFDMHLEGALDCTHRASEGSQSIQGNCPTYVWEHAGDERHSGQLIYGDLVSGERDEDKGIGYYAEARVCAQGGRVSRHGAVISVTGADSATVYFAVRTSFNGFDKHPVLEGKEYVKPCLDDLENASSTPYSELKARHVADHAALYDRVKLHLDGALDEATLPTDQRLYLHEDGSRDPALYALLFNFGRYLIIAASREGTQPTNLQGIWNPLVMPPWNSNYTININTEMNYWPVLPCNLPECNLPLISMIRELSVSGKRTASEYYGARGFCSHHNTDLWRMSTPVGAGHEGTAVFAYWPMSSGWFIRHVWDHYVYTLDAAYLRDVAYPIIRDAALFYIDTLVEDASGHMVCAPSTSPENSYLLDGKRQSVAKTTTMTTAIIRDVFQVCMNAEKVLGAPELSEQLAELIEKLLPFETGSHGELLEWSEELEESEIHHRHTSHLYGLHPAHQITPTSTPELAEACRASLERRGDDGTGWSLGWKINHWARLHDGDHALRLIDRQLITVEGRNPSGKSESGEQNYHHGGTYLNFFDAHPPFQIDGNYGATAGIAEMLLQADFTNNPLGDLLILPALPNAWRSGSVTGLRAPGNRVVDIEWKDGKATNVVVHDLNK